MRKPDLTGVGKAWRIDLDLVQSKDQTATLESWLIQGPWHPAWTFWQVSAIHLRDIPGVPPAKKQFPDAEYEFVILSLQSPPGSPEVHPDPDQLETLKVLLPVDVTHQFAADGLTDRAVRRVVRAAVAAVIHGQMSPDSDYRSSWLDALEATLRHERAGLGRE